MHYLYINGYSRGSGKMSFTTLGGEYSRGLLYYSRKYGNCQNNAIHQTEYQTSILINIVQK